MRFYKFQRVNEYTIKGLQEKKLWKSDPVSFNDPFELRLMHLDEEEIYSVKGLSKIRQENADLSYLSDSELFYMVISELQNYLYRFRVISFTEKNDDILMWAHYGADHKGICLGFEVDDTNKEGLYKVNYSDDYPELNLENIWHIEGLAKILLNKSSHWSYEKEWRKIFIEPEEFSCDYPDRFSEIILGARISEENENRIREIYNKDSVNIRKAFLHPKRYELIIE